MLEATGEDYPPPWFGLFAPAGTPQPIVDKVHAEVMRIASVPDWRQKQFRRARGRARDRSARRVHQVHRRQPRVRRAKVAKEAGIKPQSGVTGIGEHVLMLSHLVAGCG